MSVRRSVTAGPGGVYDLGYHLVWCPKYRRALLNGQVAVRLDELLRAKAEQHGWTFVSLQVMPDHVHAFVRAAPRDSPAYIVQQLKGFSSKALRDEFPEVKSKLPTMWSRSFFAATVGAVSADTIQRYLDTQWERPWRKEPTRLVAGEASTVL